MEARPHLPNLEPLISEISGDARRDDACAAALSDCETALRLTEALAAVTIGDGLVRGSAADDL